MLCDATIDFIELIIIIIIIIMLLRFDLSHPVHLDTYFGLLLVPCVSFASIPTSSIVPSLNWAFSI
jgi:hypothetical protein